MNESLPTTEMLDPTFDTEAFPLVKVSTFKGAGAKSWTELAVYYLEDSSLLCERIGYTKWGASHPFYQGDCARCYNYEDMEQFFGDDELAELLYNEINQYICFED